jgi:hypothetical protein
MADLGIEAIALDGTDDGTHELSTTANPTVESKIT